MFLKRSFSAVQQSSVSNSSTHFDGSANPRFQVEARFGEGLLADGDPDVLEAQVAAVGADLEERLDLDLAKPRLLQPFQPDVTEFHTLYAPGNLRLVADAEKLVDAVGLLVELDAVDVADACAAAVVNGALRHGAVRIALASWKQPQFVPFAEKVPDQDVVDGTEADGG